MEQRTRVTARLFLISQMGVVVASLAYKSLSFLPGAVLGTGISSLYEFKFGAFSPSLQIVHFALWLLLVLTILVESGGKFSTAVEANEINTATWPIFLLQGYTTNFV